MRKGEGERERERGGERGRNNLRLAYQGGE
jgi:hypothetical protein